MKKVQVNQIRLSEHSHCHTGSFSRVSWHLSPSTLFVEVSKLKPWLSCQRLSSTLKLDSLPSSAYDTLSSLGPRGRDIYKEINRVDFLLAPIVFREYILHTIPPTSLERDRVRDFLANTYILGEAMENTSIAIMLKTFPKLLDLFAWTGCVGNLLKWFGFCGGVVSVLYEGFVWVRERKIKPH